MKKLIEPTELKPSAGFPVFVGSTPCKVGVAVRKQESEHGVDSEQQLEMLGIDAEGIITTFPIAMVNDGDNQRVLGPHEFMPVSMHDSESLEEAEKSGKLWPMLPNWYLQPGVSKDDLGSGGRPRTGNAYGRINYNGIKKKLRYLLRHGGDYCWQRQLLGKMKDSNLVGLVITVLICVSFLGGLGTGMVVMIMRIIRELELELKLKVRIILSGMMMGSLEPTDKNIAICNEEMILRDLNARVIGQFKDIEDERAGLQPLCDSLILTGNINDHGELDNLDKLICQEADYIFYLFHTPLGNKILERAVDLEESWPDDPLGGKLWASTKSISKFHLDMPLVLKGIAYKLLQRFCECITVDRPFPEAKKEAELIASEQMLVETRHKDMACERLFRPEGNAKSHVCDDTIGLFKDRAGNRLGFANCCDLGNASKYILDVEIPRNIKPKISRHAQVVLAAVMAAIGNRILAFLQCKDGFAQAKQFIEELSIKILEYRQINTKKLNNIQAKRKSIDDRLSKGHELINRLKAKFWFFRMLCFGIKKQIRRIFQVQTEQAIRSRLEISARTLLANEVYPALQEYLTKKGAEVQRAMEKALVMGNKIASEVNRLEHFDPTLLVSLGIEFADANFIQKQYELVLSEEGGLDKVLDKQFAEFHGHFKNLIAFNHHDIAAIEEVLHDYCLGTAQLRTGKLNVHDALNESIESDEEKKSLVAQALRESSGRLRTTGEGDRVIPVIKFIGAGNKHRALWMEQTANAIDKTDGQWQTFETGDPYTILLLQQRARVSITQLIRNNARLWKKPKTAEQYVNLGSCPVMTFAPTADCSQNEVREYLAMAIAAKRIVSLNGGYQFRGSVIIGDVYLGSQPDEMVEYLQKHYRHLMDLYRSFVVTLAAEKDAVSQALIKYAQEQPQSNGDLTIQIGRESFAAAMEKAKALLPHITRWPREVLSRVWLEYENGSDGN